MLRRRYVKYSGGKEERQARRTCNAPPPRANNSARAVFTGPRANSLAPVSSNYQTERTILRRGVPSCILPQRRIGRLRLKQGRLSIAISPYSGLEARFPSLAT